MPPPLRMKSCTDLSRLVALGRVLRNMVRALVTGGSGFVGRWLAAHLRDSGDEVVVTDHEHDVTDANAMRRVFKEHAPEAVYHLAGRPHVGASWDDPVETFRVNALGTVAVLAAARMETPLPKVLVVSSAEVYGTVTADELPLREGSPLRPVSPYALSKVAAEVAAQQAHLGYGVPALVARPFNHIGPGQPPSFVVSDFARRVVAAERSGERVLRVGNTTPRRDLTDVRDVVRAYRLIVTMGSPGTTYNVCSGSDIEIGALARRMIELAGLDMEVQTDDELVRPVDIPVLRGDSSRLHDATGWTPSLSLDDTLRAVLAYWREKS